MHRPSFAVVLTLFIAAVHPSMQDDDRFVRLAEGFTAPTAQARVTVSRRMFSAPDFAQTCAGLARPERLLSTADSPVLRIGVRFIPSDLRVAAFDAEGRIVAPVPITIDVDVAEPPVVLLRANQMDDVGVLPVRKGRMRFRFRTLCPGPIVEAIVAAMVGDR